MHTRMRPFTFLLSLAYVANLASFAVSFQDFQNCSVEPDLNRPANLSFDIQTVKKSAPVDRQFSLSTESPVAANLRQDANGTEQVERLFQLIRNISEIIDIRNKSRDPRACNLRKGDAWVSPSLDNVQIRQVGQFDDICNTAIVGDEVVEDSEVANGTIRSLIEDAPETIERANIALFDAIKSIDVRPNPNNSLLNWTDEGAPFPIRDWNIRRESQRCIVHAVFAYRVNSEWYVAAAMTNHDVDSYEEDYQRQTINEYVHESFDFSLNMTQPSYCNSSFLEHSTTVLRREGRRQGLSHVYPMGYLNNPAITDALETNEVNVDLAEDAITVSNIAILALPMVMSLIPVAFLADLNTCATLWYIIFTDVFSALPFLVKGVELINTARKSPPNFVAYQMGNHTIGQIEMWTSVCSGEDSFRTLGIIFVVLALCGTIVGISIEMFANRYMQRKRAAEGQTVDGPFGHAIFNATTESLLGGHALAVHDSDSDSAANGVGAHGGDSNTQEAAAGHASAPEPRPSAVIVSATSRGSGDLV